MKKIINAATGTVTFRFEGTRAADGTVTPLADVVLDVARMSEANRVFGLLHGMSARVGDAAAIEAKDAPGNRVTEAMRREAVARMVEHYHSGSTDWSPTGRAAKAPALNPAIVALAQARNCTYEEAQAWIANMALEEMGKAA